MEAPPPPLPDHSENEFSSKKKNPLEMVRKIDFVFLAIRAY